MDSFFKNIDELSTLLKQFNASIKMPKLGADMPKPPKAPGPKMTPGMAPTSKKDPVKVANQLKNPDLKPSIKIAKNGQWSL